MSMDPIKILLVEDNPGDARLMKEMLSYVTKISSTLVHVDRLYASEELLKKQDFDLILLDLSLPDSTGIETVQHMSAIAKHVPIIVLTGMNDDAIALETIQNGAQDYLVKGVIDEDLLVRSIRHSIERKQMEKQLLYLATHDPLTELPNRALFQDRLEHALERSTRYHQKDVSKWEVALLMIDLDNFKPINDTFGHSVGDLVLQAVADRLQKNIRKSDTVARMGGDEFTVIFENITGELDCATLADRILNVFSQPFELGQHTLKVKASIGISLYPQDGEDCEKLFKNADNAMYAAKQTGDTYRYYAPSIST